MAEPEIISQSPAAIPPPVPGAIPSDPVETPATTDLADGPPSLPVDTSADIPDYTSLNQPMGAPKNSGLSVLDQIKAREEEIKTGNPATRADTNQVEQQQSEEAGLAKQVGKGSLGPPGLANLTLRADMGLSDTFDARQAKFMNTYPDGSMVQVVDPANPQQRIELFRRNDQEPYAKVDAGALEKFEPLGDIADISSDVGIGAIEAAVTRGGTLVSNVIRTFLGGAAGNIANDAIEKLRGYQKKDIGEIVGKAAMSGAMDAAGAGLTTLVSGPLNYLRGAGIFKTATGAAEGIAAAQRLDIPALHVGQVARSPFLQKMAGQSAQLSSAIPEYEKQQSAAAVRALTSMRDQDVKAVLAGDVSKLNDEARTQVIRAAIANPKELAEGGVALQNGIAEYDDLTSMTVGKLYADARNMEPPVFDTSPAISVGANIVAKAQALGRDVPPLIQDAIDRLQKFDPSAPPVQLPSGEIIDSTAQLRAIRTDLWDMKTVPPGAVLTPEQRETARQAGDLYYAVGRVLDDPKNVSPEFRDAWKTAATEAKSRFDTLEKLVIIKAAREESPEQLADRLVAPLNYSNLTLLKKIVPPEQWDTFRQAAISRLTDSSSVDKLTQRLKSFDSPTLHTLFSLDEIQGLKGVGQQIDRLNAINLPGIVDQSTKRGDIAFQALTQGNPNNVDAFLGMVDKYGGPDMRKDLRAGLIDSLYNRNTKTVAGIPTIDWSSFTSDLDKLTANGGMRILTPEDVTHLRDLKLAGDLMKVKTDSGSSMMAGQAVANLMNFPERGLATLWAALQGVRAATVGHIFTSPTGIRILTGQAASQYQKSEPKMLRAVGAALGEIANDKDATKQDDEQ